MSTQRPLPPSINFHFWRPCNMRCGFCFATFEPEIPHPARSLDEARCLAVVEAIGSSGAIEKLTFAGGEPTLSKWLPRLVAAAKRRGLTTMIVTNGTGDLSWALEGERMLDWVAFSVDSTDADRNRASGRTRSGRPLDPAKLLDLAAQLRDAGVRIKLNTVVHRFNKDDDMSGFVAALNPERWKVLQVLPVEGQNDADIERFAISEAEFGAYVERHRSALSGQTTLVPETNDEIRGTYGMVDPAGRFFDSTDGGHTYSAPILDVGIERAWQEVGFSADGYEARGARYDWATPLVQIRGVAAKAPKFVAFAGRSGSGKDTAAALLIDRGYQRVAVIDPLKHALAKALDLRHEQLWGDERNLPVEGLGLTPRKLFQVVSDVVLAVRPTFWLDLWAERVQYMLAEGNAVVCTDIRTLAELQRARELGAIMIRIERNTAGAPDEAAQHSTETVLAALPAEEFDAVIHNDGTLEQLDATLRRLLQRQ